MKKENSLVDPVTETDNQKVFITLKQYMEYQELLKHKKEVKITETSKFVDRDVQSISCFWNSDGAVWSMLTAKLDIAGQRIAKLVEENKRLKEYKQAGFLKRVLMRIAGEQNV